MLPAHDEDREIHSAASREVVHRQGAEARQRKMEALDSGLLRNEQSGRRRPGLARPTPINLLFPGHYAVTRITPAGCLLAIRTDKNTGSVSAKKPDKR